MAECPNCKGTGKTKVPSFVDSSKTIDRSCSACKGKGMLPDDRSNDERAAYVAGMLEAGDLCGLEYISSDATDGRLGDEDQAYNAAVAYCIGAIRAAASKSVPEGYVLVERERIQRICEGVRRAVISGVLDSRSMAADECLLLEAMLAEVKP